MKGDSVAAMRTLSLTIQTTRTGQGKLVSVPFEAPQTPIDPGF